MNNLIARSITGIIFVTAIVVSFRDPIAMVALFALITGMTVWEFGSMINKNTDLSISKYISTLAGVILFLAVAGYCSGYISLGFVFIPYLVVIVCLFISGVYEMESEPLEALAYTALGQLYVALPFSMISVLAFNTNYESGYVSFNKILPLSVFIFIWANDTGAYCFGSLFGKHKLFESISPKKTWEGVFGGIATVLVAAIIISIVNQSMLIHFKMSTPLWIGLGLVVSVFGTYGDLLESRFKRCLFIKDSGHILPGHGGMLDRFDSSLLAIPAAVLYMFVLSAFE